MSTTKTERHCGAVVRELTCSGEGPWIEITFDQVSRKLSLFTQQQMDTLQTLQVLFRAGEGLGSEGRGDRHHSSHAVPIRTSGT